MPINEKVAPRQIVIGPLATVNAGTGATYAVFNPSFAGEIVGFNMSQNTTVNVDANSYTTVNIDDMTTTTHTLASISNLNTTLTAQTNAAGTLATTKTNRRFNSGDAIVIHKVETGAGATLTTPWFIHLEVIAGTVDA